MFCFSFYLLQRPRRRDRLILWHSVAYQHVPDGTAAHIIWPWKRYTLRLAKLKVRKSPSHDVVVKLSI